MQEIVDFFITLEGSLDILLLFSPYYDVGRWWWDAGINHLLITY